MFSAAEAAARKRRRARDARDDADDDEDFRLRAAMFLVLLTMRGTAEAVAPERAFRPRWSYPRPNYSVCRMAEMLSDPELYEPGTRAARMFRRRFRVPAGFFADLLRLLEESGQFTVHADAAGRLGPPLSLRLLSALHVLGRGVPFDEVTMLTGISDETARYTRQRAAPHSSTHL